jgi:hypothetical protein
VLGIDEGFRDQRRRSRVQRRLMPIRSAQRPIEEQKAAEQYEKDSSDEAQ